MIEKLFSPFNIRNLHLKNRIVMPGLACFLVEADGTITDKAVEYYRIRAAGGASMVIMEACAVSPEGIVSPHQARIYDDRFTEGLSRIARALKAEGAVPAVQLHHGGRQTSARVIKQKPLAPSDLPCPAIKGEVTPLTIDGIQDLVHKFGEAAARAAEAGFELIEIHGAHGYLVNQFLSRFSNVREDDYGADLIGRSRFAREIIREMKRAVGEDFPISFKISAQEFVPDGRTVDESIEILKQLVEEGIDVVQVSAGNDATPEWICQPAFMERACLVNSAARIKKAFDIPVMAVGRINDPLLADSIISEGKADLVCIGRGLLADPEFPNKAKEGKLDDIRICIACNTCMESIFRKGQIECLVNPTLGREKEMQFTPADPPKKVMVIGGGPGGLDAAWSAARRGHEVHLYEKESALGGLLNLGAALYYKKELLSLIRFQKRQIEKYGVRCHLNFEATLDTVKEENPDVVILATGSTPIIPAVPGIDKSITLTVNEVFNGNKPAIKTTAVVGGGANGCEVALYLAEHGCTVTIVEETSKVCGKLEAMTRKILLGKLKEKSVGTLLGHRLIRVEDSGIVVTGNAERKRFIEAESVVIALGNEPENRLYGQIKSLGIAAYRIGDCLEPRNAKAAIREGAVIGRIV
jgi:2,4-dienoyl-CoA reductase-like NADH-dependent reductase (Old Yellow Enzyme family)/thioredoxin reductase